MEYELRNFKAFPDSGRLPLRPITLIYGPNSSGKSSILQSFLLLKQTIEEAESPETLLLPKANLTDLGSYREFIHRHELERAFSFRISQTIDDSRRRERVAGPLGGDVVQILGIRELGLGVTFAYDEMGGNVFLKELAFFADEDREPFAVFAPPPLGDATRKDPPGRLSLRSNRSGASFVGSRINPAHPLWRRARDAELSSVAQFAPRAELKRTITALRRQLQTVEKATDDVAPTARASQARRRSPRAPSQEGLRGEIAMFEQLLQNLDLTWEEVLGDYAERVRRTVLSTRTFLPGEGQVTPRESSASTDRYLGAPFYLARDIDVVTGLYGAIGRVVRKFLEDLVYIGPLRESPERHYIFSGNVTGQVGKTGRSVPDILFKDGALLDRVNEQLERFEIGHDLVIAGSPTGELNDVFSLRLRDRITGVNANILDVGFGISQVLPVIVQSMLSSRKTLCIEQPEIHLHPRLQAELGSLVAACTKPPYSNRFVIETHSQHLMLRIQRLIRSGTIQHSDVSVLYVDKTPEGSRCLELRLDADGDFIDEWPNGFFEEGYAEIFAR